MTDQERPVLRVVRGEPTDGELAAVTVALLAVVRAGEPAAAGRAGADGWADRRAALQRPLEVGPGAWTRSARVPGVRTRATW